MAETPHQQNVHKVVPLQRLGESPGSLWNLTGDLTDWIKSRAE